MIPPLLVLALYVLAVARVTTLITHDQITRPVRAWAVRRFDGGRRAHRLLVYLLGDVDGDESGCPWCMSVWVGAVTAPVVCWWWETAAVAVALVGLAASQVTGMIYAYGRQ